VLVAVSALTARHPDDRTASRPECTRVSTEPKNFSNLSRSVAKTSPFRSGN